MKKHDDFVSGPHRYGIHFFAGLVYGGLMGWWTASSWLDETSHLAVATAGCAVAVAFFAGRWGEVAWARIADWLKHWWEAL